jgi:serine/threonine protein phosphatase PrpC
MKSTTIKQLMENYIHQQNSNKDIAIKKLPTQTNHNYNIKKNIIKDLKNPSIKTRRKPRCFNMNKNYFEPNKKKLKSCSRYKNTQNNQIFKYKNIVKYPKQNMNRTICTDGYGNIITNIHDRNLSAPSLNYDNTLNHKKIMNKKKKNNIIKLTKIDKKSFDENLINRDNYMNHAQLNINTIKDDENKDKIKNKPITENNIDKFDKGDDYDSLIKVKTLEKDDYNYNNNIKNNINIKNFYKNINNKKHNEIKDNSKIDLSNFIKDIEFIKNKKESIALLKEQLKYQDNNYKNNKPKLNKTINTANNNNQNENNKIKNNNRINLVNKNGYVLSNFHNYNKYAANRKNKNKNYINQTNNNTYYNNTSTISKDLTPNKQISNTTRGNINLSNSSNNNKTITISTNITNNNNNSFGKKINLINIYGGEDGLNNNDEKNINDNIIQKEEEIINNKDKDNDNVKIYNNNNSLNDKKPFNSERNIEDNSIKNNDIININDEVLSFRSNNSKESKIKSDNLDNINNTKKLNYMHLAKPNKNANISNREINTLSLNIKNKNSLTNKESNRLKEKKDNHNVKIQKQTKNLNQNNKKKYISKNNYNTNNSNKINDANNPLSSRFNTINAERCNNFDENHKNKKKINNRDISYDIVNNNKGISKAKLKKVLKYKDKNNNRNIEEDNKIKKKNSCKPYINKNKSADKEENMGISLPNKVKKYLTKGEFKYKSIYKIGVICEAGEVVFGEKKTNQDNYFNSLINDDLRFIGVCDGHGEFGHHVSNYLRNFLPKQLEKSIKKFYKKEESSISLLQKEMSGYCNPNVNTSQNIDSLDNRDNNDNDIFEKMKNIFEKSFSKTDKNLSQYCQKLNEKENSEQEEESIFNVEYSGSTCISLLLKEKNINKIYIANVGDSRAIVIKELENQNYSSFQLSRDHKPTEEDEAQRVLDYDGEIEKIEDDDGNWTGPLRVWVKGSDGPGLAMTRSFGDEIGASVGVVSVPEVGEYKIKEEDKAIIIASDGLWEYMSNEDVTKIVKNLIGQKDPNIIVNELYRESIIKWRLKDQGIDDITIICILFKTS